MMVCVTVCLTRAGVAEALDNGLGRTPVMGWNSWNAYGCGINEKLIRYLLPQSLSSLNVSLWPL